MTSAGSQGPARAEAEPSEPAGATGATGATGPAERQEATASAAALARYRARMRPLRLIYAAGIVAAIVVALVLVKIAYIRGEVSHVHLHTVATGVPNLGDRPPSGALTKAWSSTDHTAVGVPYFGGTVVTYDDHTVRGRDGRTGAQTWSYTRTDRTVCSAMQNNGLTVAVYQLHGNCDELTALATTTGDRVWTRTLDKDTAEFNGPAQFQVAPDYQPAPDDQLQANSDAPSAVFFFVSRSSVYAISNNGVDWWTFHHVGCTINSAVVGSAGALISQTCTNQDCGSVQAKLCGNGPQLLLVPEASRDSSPPTDNPDQIIWARFGTNLVPALADNTLAARDPTTGRLALLDKNKGTTQTTLPLRSSPVRGGPQSASTTDADLLWLDGHTYALRAGARAFAWQTASSGPAVAFQSGGEQPSLAHARITVPTAAGIGRLDPRTGRPEKIYRGPRAAVGSRVYPFNNGFLVAGSQTAVFT